MFVKRTAELKLLEEQYTSQGSKLIILYGRKGLGKTTLLTQFMDGKMAYYYTGVECVDKMQLQRMNRQLGAFTVNPSPTDFSTLFTSLIKESEQKPVIILDEFHLIIKNSPDFLEALGVLSDLKHPVLIILSSSSIKWVENEMIPNMGAFASYISTYRKLKEFTFVDFVNRFPKSSVESCIYINAILGGVPDYLNDWKEDRSVRENIKHILLDKNSRLFLEPQQFLKQELREPAVYNTILCALAGGRRKLNDLHEHTGFSRAKISVYLKHLIQLDLVEKLVPVNEEGKENVQKGIYRIKDNFFSFWYRFIFTNLSELMLGRVSSVYDKWIEPYLEEYMGEYFADVCTEYLKLMNLHQRLSEKYLWWDRWYGKNGTIDVLAQGSSQKMLVGKCLWEDRKMDTGDYEKLLSLSEEAGLRTAHSYLFSKGGFTEELRLIGKEKSFVILVGLEDL